MQKGELDGLVCVNMASEGIDIPELQIAAFHGIPKSPGFFLQFVGRISRNSKKNDKPAVVVYSPEDLRGEAFDELLKEGDFYKIVNSIDKEIRDQIEIRTKGKLGVQPFTLGITPSDINPYLSIRVFSSKCKALKKPADSDKNFNLTPFWLDNSKSYLAVISEQTVSPPWIKSRTKLVSTRYDLHLYHLDKRTELLFESTTREEIANVIREEIAGNYKLKPLTMSKLKRIIQDDVPEYHSIGMVNARTQSPLIPTYMSIMGRSVQSAVKSTDGRTFTAKTFLVTISDPIKSKKKTRIGVSGRNYRIWFTNRASIEDFKKYCEWLAEKLSKYSCDKPLPGLETLSTPVTVSTFENRKPIAILFDESKLSNSVRMEIAKKPYMLVEPGFKNLRLAPKSEKILHCDFFPDLENQEVRIRLKFDISKNLWSLLDKKIEVRFKEDKRNDDPNPFTVSKFFSDECKPLIYLDDGSLLIGNELYKSLRADFSLPEDLQFETPDFEAEKCDITVEFRNPEKDHTPKEGMITVHEG
ncbi:MAG: hypothetical protein PWQ27_1572 [Kosmotoga sp.]|nr:hypothetical protein [Kosmotoga sp.]